MIIKHKYYPRYRRFTIDTLREKWFGQDRNQRTLLGVFRLSILDLEKLVDKGLYRKSTLVKYQTTEKHLKDYLEVARKGLRCFAAGPSNGIREQLCILPASGKRSFHQFVGQNDQEFKESHSRLCGQGLAGQRSFLAL